MAARMTFKKDRISIRRLAKPADAIAFQIYSYVPQGDSAPWKNPQQRGLFLLSSSVIVFAFCLLKLSKNTLECLKSG